MDLGLQNMVAIVTGGSFGIGRAAAERFAREGARVAIVARKQADLDTAAAEIAAATGAEVLPVAADVGNREQVQAMAERVRDRFGRIDILVNNAGTGNANPFEAMDDELLEADLQLKLYGAVHCIRAALPALKERGGVVINITTPAGKAAPGASVPTSLSRAAGIALTKALANEYARRRHPREHGVREQHQEPPERPPLAGSSTRATRPIRWSSSTRTAAGRFRSGGSRPPRKRAT